MCIFYGIYCISPEMPYTVHYQCVECVNAEASSMINGTCVMPVWFLHSRPAAVITRCNQAIHSTKPFMRSWLKSCTNLVCSSLYSKWSNQVIILHMPWQLSCHGIRKITTWLDQVRFWSHTLCKGRSTAKVGIWWLKHSAIYSGKDCK